MDVPPKKDEETSDLDHHGQEESKPYGVSQKRPKIGAESLPFSEFGLARRRIRKNGEESLDAFARASVDPSHCFTIIPTYAVCQEKKPCFLNFLLASLFVPR
jgi:hypothetical protein